MQRKREEEMMTLTAAKQAASLFVTVLIRLADGLDGDLKKRVDALIIEHDNVDDE